jgi:glycerophosphoryl diester phosphodiesterase
MLPRLIRWCGLAAVLGGLLSILFAFVGEDSWAHVPLDAARYAFLAVGIVGIYLYLRPSERFGLLGTVGFYTCVFIFALVAISDLSILVNEGVEQTHIPLGPARETLLLLLGLLLFGAALVRAGRLPRAGACLLIAAAVVGISAMIVSGGALGALIFILATVLFGLGWGWLGYGLWSEEASSAQSLDRVLSGLGRVYLLRVPLLTGFGFAGVCCLAFTRAKSLMGGAFDINSDWGIFWVSLIAFLFASAVEVTWRLIRCYGPKRLFDHPLCNTNLGWSGSIGYSLLIALVALPPIGGALYRSTELSFRYECKHLPFDYECKVFSFWPALGQVFLGFVVSLIFIAIVVFVQLWFDRPAVATRSPDLFLLSMLRPFKPLFYRLRSRDPIGWLAERIISRLGCERMSRIGPFARKITAFFQRFQQFPEGLGRGFLVYENSRVSILPGHITALALFALTFVIYVWLGIEDLSNVKNGTSTTIPTLCYVLLLFTLLCWGLSALAFLLDRYRIPVLVPLVTLLWITSFTPGLKSDFYYPVTKPETPVPIVPKSEQPKEKLPQKKIIVVAATGGGIQSATWTARVLTGLEEKCRKEKCEQSFDKSIRLISAVSGGSVGTMHFVNEYKGGHLPAKETDPRALEKIVARAERSSLDYVLWGLLYPDLARLFIPLPYKLEWDRGRALQKAWKRDTGVGINDLLSEWRNDGRNNSRADDRPAVIFNTTVTETGQRLPLTTTEPLKHIAPPEPVVKHEDVIEKGETRTDVSVLTAARLSAAFPYVSPAARAEVDGTAAHLVDGGYYDNYGISTLIEWLDAELESNPEIGEVLVVEIRGAGGSCATEEQKSREERANSTEGTKARDGRIERKRGWFYQTFAPLWTVLHVRGPAQRATNEVALDLLIQKWGEKSGEDEEDEGGHHVEITRAVFSFDGKDAPTSWHLTEKQKVAIRDNWDAEINNECNNDQGWDEVANFLGAEVDPREPSKVDEGAQRPKGWPASPVNIAHRGGRYLAPENTLIGFQEGLLRAGVDVLEFDVHLTEDGHLVVIHDDEVDRTTDGTGLVREMTLREIKGLDAGYDFPDEDSKTHPYRGQGITVPTLEEVYQQFPETPVNIEIKEAQPGIEEDLWEEIEGAGAIERTLVVSQKRSVIQRFRAVSGGKVTTGASIGEIGGYIFWSHIYPSLLLQTPYQALQVPKQMVTPGFVQVAHESHHRVDVWTVNKEEDMRRQLGYGVDGIMTDRPDDLNQVLQGGKGR